mgnify:CR=1 FL=1
MLNPVKNLMKDNELEGSVSVISDEITITGTVTSSGNLIINNTFCVLKIPLFSARTPRCRIW